MRDRRHRRHPCRCALCEGVRSFNADATQDAASANKRMRHGFAQSLRLGHGIRSAEAHSLRGPCDAEAASAISLPDTRERRPVPEDGR